MGLVLDDLYHFRGGGAADPYYHDLEVRVMKKLLLSGIILWLVVIITLVSVMMIGMRGGFAAVWGEKRILKNERISSDGLRNIMIESASTGIELIKTSGSELKITQYSTKELSEESLFTVEQNGDTVKIKIELHWRHLIFNINFDDKLVVEIPDDWNGNVKADAGSGGIKVGDPFHWQAIEFKATSGGININEKLDADNLTFKASSGGIRAKAGLAAKEKLSANATSGGIRLEGNIKADEVAFSTSSGGINLGEIETKKYDIHATSGGIHVAGISGGGSVKSSSGGIHITLKEPEGDINVAATSGGIRILIDESLKFGFTAKTTSGGIKTDFATHKNSGDHNVTALIGEDPSVNINVKASSGGIQVRYE